MSSAPDDTPQPSVQQELVDLAQGLRGVLLWQRETAVQLVGAEAGPWAGPLAAVSARTVARATVEPRANRKDAAAAALPSTRPSGDPAADLLRLREELGDCQRCKLAGSRRKIVFGAGSPSPLVLFVGEGPGATEDRRGVPFVGASGELLDAILEKGMGLRRDQVYIANIVKCRPPQNRDPETDEVAACLPFLKAQVSILAPRAIVALGRVAAQILLHSTVSLGQLRESWHEFEGISLRATYHPAFLLRYPERKRAAWEDIQAVMARLGLKRPSR